MSAFLVLGYKNSDLGIFDDKDERVKVLKKLIKKDLIILLEEGVDWFIFTGNLGFEYWVLEVARELRIEYDFFMGTIFLFANQGEEWNETNQEKLARFKGLDFVKYAFKSYQNPGQFKQYNQFLIDNTQGAYMFYDSENETKLKYLYQQMINQPNFDIRQLTFEELNDFFLSLEDEE